MSSPAPASRVTHANAAPVAARGRYVLYWMIAARRTRWSFALEHAISRARDLERPLLVFEPLRAGYRWASDRLHAFVLQGMAANRRAFEAVGVTYVPYVERAPWEGRGLLAALAAHACLVVTDEQPGFFLPRMVTAAAAALPVRVELVDGNGLLPLRATTRAYPSAAAFRRVLQRELPGYLAMPSASPLSEIDAALRSADVAGTTLRRWRSATTRLLQTDAAALRELEIDHDVPPASISGGQDAAQHALESFLAHKLDRYSDGRNDPDDDVSSGLSPYLHFGHVGVHGVAARLFASCDWSPARLLTARATGRRDGYWGLTPGAEAFLDEIVTWRELGYGFCFHRRDYDRWSSLPRWARDTLAAHASDPRPAVYRRSELEAARTDDEVWNAAQRQLRREGRIHNYLRMLWGKLVITWSASPRSALATLIELNNRYALDGRDPNSYSGIFWTFGRFDRPWPERDVFGTVRAMTSKSTRAKLNLRAYLARWRP